MRVISFFLVGIIFGIIGLVGHRAAAVRFISQIGLVASLAFLINRSWITVLVERELYEGQCGMDAGFPSWLALDKWFPNVFEVWTMCGFTPDLLFGLTMGEGLLYGGCALTAVAVLALTAMIYRQWFSN
jgi:disulfide bond formation protein DsbB